jgi:hypothetical protein
VRRGRVVFGQFGLPAEARCEEQHLVGSVIPKMCQMMNCLVKDSLANSPAVRNASLQHFVRLKLLRLDRAVHHQRTLQSQSSYSISRRKD